MKSFKEHISEAKFGFGKSRGVSKYAQAALAKKKEKQAAAAAKKPSGGPKMGRGRHRADGSSAVEMEPIQIQLRKVRSLRGQNDILFANGKTLKVSQSVADKVTKKIDSIRMGKNKQLAIQYISKSPENLRAFAADKEGEIDPKKARMKAIALKQF